MQVSVKKCSDEKKLKINENKASGFHGLPVNGVFDVCCNCNNIHFENIFVEDKKETLESKEIKFVSVGPLSATWKNDSENPEDWGEVFAPDSVCFADNIYFNNISFIDGKAENAEELVKEAYAAFVKKDWKTGFDIATNLSMNAISDSYVTYHVGYCHSPTYRTNYPNEKDYAKAYEWFKRTAELERTGGDGIVQAILGDMELSGPGCLVSTNNAIAWYRISAERKYARGCYELGECYEDNIVADTK